jgi:hypothetical protein
MTIAKLIASPVYYERVFRPVPVTPVATIVRGRFNSRSTTQKRNSTDWVQEWIVPVLTLVGTAAAMWFVVTEGWFQLFGFWAM